MESFFATEINDSELLVGSHQTVQTRIQSYIMEDAEVSIYDSLDSIARILEKFIFSVPWGKMFKMDIISDNNLRFPVGIKWGEDSRFVAEYLMFCKKIKFVSKAIYNYNCINQNSITNRQIWEEEKLLWDQGYIDKHKKTLEAYGVEEKEIRARISKKALIMCALDIRTIVLHSKSVADSEKDVLCAINAFKDRILAEKDWIYEEESPAYRQRYEMIEKQDVQALYERFSTKNLRLFDKIKNKMKKVLNPLLEKHRDGLIKFKF